MDEPTLLALKEVWQQRRPFLAAAREGVCPLPATPESLASAGPQEGTSGKAVQLRADALEAWRRMLAAARAEAPSVAADPQLLTLFSGYRDPYEDLLRCAVADNCGTAVRAFCSAHRTGLAMDLFLGAAPGFGGDATADANRLWQTRTEAYRWLVANAWRFGFVNYAFEPWHWEWTGQAR